MRYTALVAFSAGIFAAASAHAQVDQSDLTKKRQIFGGGLAVGYGLAHCDLQATPQQRAAFDAKMTALRKQLDLGGELSDAQTKELIGLKSADDEKMFCTGLRLTFPGMLAGLLAEKPVKEWSKTDAKTAEVGSSPTKAGQTDVAGWTVGPVAGSPGVCQIAYTYKDKDDDNADNAIVFRGVSDGFVLALSYARWNWTAGETMTVSLTTPDDVVQGDAAWTADTTGKVLVTRLPKDAQGALAKAEDLTVKFSDGDAVFQTPKLGEALEALKTCSVHK